MVRLLIFLFLVSTGIATAQLPLNEKEFFSRVTPGNSLPEKLLSTKSVVFYPFNMSMKELETVQASFHKTGVDAAVYFEFDLLVAGRDVCMATAQYLNSREITNLVLFQKNEAGYTIYITEYNKKANFVEQDQPVWRVTEKSLEELMRKAYRAAASSQKKENFLINEFPEPGSTINPIAGKRNEFYAADLKVDALAVPKFGNEAMDKELEEIMKSYPYKYTLTEPGLSEADLRKQGLLFVLRFVHARAKVAKGVLGYEMKRSESAIVSITYPGSQPHLKNIPSNTEVYKFYFKHIDSGNVYLGSKWDADDSWQQALINQLKGFKIEFRIN